MPWSRIVCDRVEDQVHQHRGQPHRRLVEQQQLRAAHQRPRRRRASAARRRTSCPAFWLIRSRSRGKSSRTRSWSAAIAVLVVAQERPEVEVLLDGHPREDPPALRASGRCPAATISWPGHRLSRSCPRRSSVPVLRPDQPGDRPQRRRLAGAVGADQGDDLALRDLQRRCPSPRRCCRSRRAGPRPRAGSARPRDRWAPTPVFTRHRVAPVALGPGLAEVGLDRPAGWS